MGDNIRYIILSDIDHYRKVKQDISNENATVEWCAPVVSCLGVKIPADHYRQVKETISAIPGVRKLIAKRRAGGQSVAFENTAEMSVAPKFSEQPEINQICQIFESDFGRDTEEITKLYEKKQKSASGKLAIIDSGIDSTNPHLNNIEKRINYTSNNELDETGHGTAVALMMNYAHTYKEIYDLKVASCTELNENSLIKSLNDVVELGPDIINISLGLWIDKTANRVFYVLFAMLLLITELLSLLQQEIMVSRVSQRLPRDALPVRVMS
jgi:hypothetical protein